MTMKRFFLPVALLSITLAGALHAQEADDAETGAEGPAVVIDADTPGMGLLDQAIETKLRANSVLDLGQVIALCQRAKRAGLTGENLKFCNDLLASTHLQRGLFFAQPLLGQPNATPNNWREIRRSALEDLEEAVTIIKDQPAAYLRIAELNLLPDGNEDRAKEVLILAVQSAADEPNLQVRALRLLAELEPEAEKREAILATAAKNGNPDIVLDHALALLELKRNDDAVNALKKLIETQSGDTELHERIVMMLIDFREYESAMSILDALRKRGTDSERHHRIDLMRAETFAKMEKYDEALSILNVLREEVREDVTLTMLTLLLRSATYLAMDNLDDALKDIEAAEQVSPNVIPVLEQKYSILIEQEKYNEALTVVKKLQTIIDRPQYALREIFVLNELEKFDESIEVAKKSQEKHPNEESLWSMVLVEIYSKQKAYDQALELVEDQLKAKPDELRWIVAKTQILTGQEKWDEAVQWLESHLQGEPDSRDITLLLISVLAEKKSYRAAKERMCVLLEKYPDDIRLLRVDSQLSISLGLHAEAVETLSKVVEADPEDYTSINNLAWVLCTSPMDSVRDGRRAVELAERAGKLTRYKRAFVLSTLAAAYAEAGDFEKAREWSVTSVAVAKAERGKTEEERKELLEHLAKEWECFSQNQPFRELLEEEEK